MFMYWSRRCNGCKIFDNTNKDRNEVFIEGSADDMMKGMLQNGDVLMFHKKFWSYNPIELLRIGLHKLTLRDSGYGHFGVVVLDMEEEFEPYT
eukprot:UN31270